MSAKCTGVKKPDGAVAQWQILPTDLDPVPSGQVFFTQCPPDPHAGTGEGCDMVGKGKTAPINWCYTMGQLLGIWRLF